MLLVTRIEKFGLIRVSRCSHVSIKIKFIRYNGSRLGSVTASCVMLDSELMIYTSFTPCFPLSHSPLKTILV